jgi:hypothetical protein
MGYEANVCPLITSIDLPYVWSSLLGLSTQARISSISLCASRFLSCLTI